MSQVQDYKCEVCGLRERDHSRWLLVSNQPQAHDIDILSWDEKLAAQPGICHLCCIDHLHVLVGSWMMPDLGISRPAEAPPSWDDPAETLRDFDFERLYLHGANPDDRESLLVMLEAVELALQGSKPDEEPAPVFDA